MTGTETPNVKSEAPTAPVENSNENPRERNPPGGGNRGPRGRKGGTRFSGGRGGGMGGGGGGGGGRNEAVSSSIRAYFRIILAKSSPKRSLCMWERHCDAIFSARATLLSLRAGCLANVEIVPIPARLRESRE